VLSRIFDGSGMVWRRGESYRATLVVFDANILAHSALVTTDIGVSCFFVAAIWTFYRYATRPTVIRLLLVGVATGLLLATKHSGILIGPMFVVLIGWEVLTASSAERKRTALQLTGAFCAIAIVSVFVLWSFYGFRYAARPAVPYSALQPRDTPRLCRTSMEDEI
jgi:dolichyl-phosphate-mannose--protein O-mannosyl transferase